MAEYIHTFDLNYEIGWIKNIFLYKWKHSQYYKIVKFRFSVILFIQYVGIIYNII